MIPLKHHVGLNPLEDLCIPAQVHVTHFENHRPGVVLFTLGCSSLMDSRIEWVVTSSFLKRNTMENNRAHYLPGKVKLL